MHTCSFSWQSLVLKHAVESIVTLIRYLVSFSRVVLTSFVPIEELRSCEASAPIDLLQNQFSTVTKQNKSIKLFSLPLASNESCIRVNKVRAPFAPLLTT